MQIPKFAWVIIGISPLMLFVGIVLLWSAINGNVAKASFRTRYISIMDNSKGAENVIDGLYKYTWMDKSAVLTSFSEECSGQKCEIYLVRASNGDIYEVENIHYCGLEGMGSVLGKYKGETDFIEWINNNNGHKIQK